MPNQNEKMDEIHLKTKPQKEVNLQAIRQTPITKAYIFRFKSLFRFAYRNIINHKIQRKKGRIFRIWKYYSKRNTGSCNTVLTEKIEKFKIKWCLYGNRNKCEKMHEDDYFCKCFRVTKIVFLYIKKITEKHRKIKEYLNAKFLRNRGKYFYQFKAVIFGRIATKHKLDAGDKTYGLNLISKAFNLFKIGVFYSRRDKTIFHRKKLYWNLLVKHVQEKINLRDTYAKDTHRYLKVRLIFKFQKKMIMFKRYHELAVCYREKVLLRKIFKAPKQVRQYQTDLFFTKQKFDDIKSKKRIKKLKKCFNEIWYYISLKKANRTNLEDATYYHSKKQIKKALISFKENMIYNFCDQHNNERLLYLGFSKLKKACIEKSNKTLLSVKILKDLRQAKSRKSIFGFLRIQQLAKEYKNSKGDQFLRNKSRSKMFMMLKAILALNRSKSRACVMFMSSKMTMKLKLQLFVLLQLNVKHGRYKKSLIRPKIQEFIKKRQILMKIKALYSLRKQIE